MSRRTRSGTWNASTFADALDDSIDTVRNARWRKVICAESLEAESLETEQPA